MKIIEDELLERILTGIIMILCIAILLIVIFKEDECEVLSDVNEIVSVVKEDDVIEEELVNTKISVDVKGAVKKAGVYELDYGSRINDALKAAGGLKSGANTKYLNMSKKIKDETVIYVYTDKQIKSMLDNKEIVEEIKEECICPEQEIIDCAGATIIETNKDNSSTSSSSNIKEENNEVQDKVESNSSSVESGTQVENSTNKVSLNTASKEELMTLKGIGEAKANAIIEYRKTNNGFKNIEEIMNVSGIGEAAFNKIKDFITV